MERITKFRVTVFLLLFVALLGFFSVRPSVYFPGGQR